MYAIVFTNISSFLNFTEILIPQRQAQKRRLEEGASAVERAPTRLHINTETLDVNYVGYWFNINNQCFPCAVSAIIIACIYDVDKIINLKLSLN